MENMEKLQSSIFENISQYTATQPCLHTLIRNTHIDQLERTYYHN